MHYVGVRLHITGTGAGKERDVRCSLEPGAQRALQRGVRDDVAECGLAGVDRVENSAPEGATMRDVDGLDRRS
jgi:hypothetical protein